MRIGELIGLTWDCVDFENEVIHVEKQLVQTRKKGQKYRFGTSKTARPASLLPLPTSCRCSRSTKSPRRSSGS